MTLGGPKRFQSKNREKKIHIFRSLLTIGERLRWKPNAKASKAESLKKSFKESYKEGFNKANKWGLQEGGTEEPSL